MIKFETEWKEINNFYVKRCIDYNRYDVYIRYIVNGYGWCPEFASKQMHNFYVKYNPDYYFTNNDIGFVIKYMDNFLNRFINLLVFS